MIQSLGRKAFPSVFPTGQTLHPEYSEDPHTEIESLDLITAVLAHLPNIEADRVYNSWLNNLFSRKDAPRHGDGLGGVAVSDVLGPLLVDNVVVDPRIARQNLFQCHHKARAGEELKIGL